MVLFSLGEAIYMQSINKFCIHDALSGTHK